jgi:hypothetical protein
MRRRGGAGSREAEGRGAAEVGRHHQGGAEVMEDDKKGSRDRLSARPIAR